MNFSIHVEEKTAKTLAAVVRKSGKTRNALINQALRAFLETEQKSKWPPEVLTLAGFGKSLKPFEDYRRELREPSEDPLF